MAGRTDRCGRWRRGRGHYYRLLLLPGRWRHVGALAHRIGQQLGMARTGDTIGQRAGPAQPGQPGAQPVCQRSKGACHSGGVDHGQHRQIQSPCQFGRRGVAIVQPHHPLDDDEIGFAGRLVQAQADVGLAGHAQIEVVDGGAAGQRVPGRIEKVRTVLEDPHPLALPAEQAGQRGNDRGLAVTGGRCADQHRRHMAGWRG